MTLRCMLTTLVVAIGTVSIAAFLLMSSLPDQEVLNFQKIIHRLEVRRQPERTLPMIHTLLPFQKDDSGSVGKAQLQGRAPVEEQKEDNGLLKVAFAITMTSDSKGMFHDGAAVLAYSIFRAVHMQPRTAALFEFISLVAFVHPNVSHWNRAVLGGLGYHVIEAATPVHIPSIKGDYLRANIDKNGCCGAAELIKLSSYLLLGYDLVLHLDADTFFTGASLYELFAEKVYQDGNRAGGRAKLLSLVYSTDPNMASHKGTGRMPVQGGFIVFRPSVSDYDQVIKIIMTTEFHKVSGWNRSLIGWFWGGMTIQGVLPYYYNAVTAPNRTLILDRCVYNTMADTKECTDTKGGTQNTLGGDGNQIVSAHFTVCQKPWGCWVRWWRRQDLAFNHVLCGALHEKWFSLRAEAETFYGLQQPKAACDLRRSYTRMDLDGLVTRGQGRPLRYLTEQLTFGSAASNGDGKAKQYRSLYRLDLSPDVLHPRPVSGFSTAVHDVSEQPR